MPEAERTQKRPQRRGPGIQPPNSRRVRPAHSTSQSSMLSAPSHHREQQRHHLPSRIRGARPIPPQPRQITLPANDSIPSRLASVATSITPASETARSSSNSTRRPSSPTASSSCTTKVTSCPQAPAAASTVKALHRRSFFFPDRTEPIYRRGGSRIKQKPPSIRTEGSRSSCRRRSARRSRGCRGRRSTATTTGTPGSSAAARSRCRRARPRRSSARTGS